MPSFEGNPKLVAIAVNKDKGSQAALKWALETICHKGQIILLIHVNLKPPGASLAPLPRLKEIPERCNAFDDLDSQTRDLLLPFRVFCSRKDVYTQEIVLEGVDVTKALIEFVKMSGIEVLVLGACAKSNLFGFKAKDTPEHTLKGVPDFCSVYIIARGKLSISRPASRIAPAVNAFRSELLHQSSGRLSVASASFTSAISRGSPRLKSFDGTAPRYGNGDSIPMRSVFSHRKGQNGKPHRYSPGLESDISFVGSGRPSEPSSNNAFEDPHPQLPDLSELNRRSSESSRRSSVSSRRSSESSKRSSRSNHLAHRKVEARSRSRNSSFTSFDNDSVMSQDVDYDEAEIQRIKQELKHKMNLYSSALAAKQKALELQNWKMEEQQKQEETRLSEESVHNEQEVNEREKVLDPVSTTGLGYRQYTIEEIKDATDRFSQSQKIGEGVYDPVYKCTLDHTTVAVKVLRPHAAQGFLQFQQEVEVLTRIRHPNMVLLLGACPEYGCLVYEYMSNGSLEDHLMQPRKFPPLQWQHRFRIAVEVTASLLFLHNTKPKPIVHGDLKLKSILLDRNLVSKLSHVGLARLIPPSVADTMTQYSAVTTGYIDPEYQQTGILGKKSDVYTLGVLLLQILTSRPPMGLANQIRRAIKSGAIAQILDPAVPDWPVEEALCLAKVALQCCELRRIDRPELGKVMPKLERLRELVEES